MSLTRELILPMNKIKNNSSNELLYSNPPNIINLILPTHQKISSIFKLSDKATQKLILTKKGISLKNFNSKHKIPTSNAEKILLKSSSGNKNIFQKINYKKQKSNSFCLAPNKDIQNEIINSSHGHVNNKSDNFSKIKINKNVRSYCTSRNVSYFGNSEDLNQVVIKINSKSKNKKANKIIKLNKSTANKSNNNINIANNSNFIPKFKAKINLSSYISQQRKGKLKPRIKITKGKLRENNNNNCSYGFEKYGNNHINITDKENINLTNLNDNNININESMLFSRPRKKASQKKLNLPFSPCSNKKEYFRQIKSKKCYIRNDINIPYNKNNHLTRQNSYYNLINHRKQRNKKLKINTTRDEQSLFGETEMFRKNNSMCSFELPSQNNINNTTYINTEFHKEIHYNKYDQNFSKNSTNENDNNDKDDCYFGVEMNHFRIVKFIQESKNMLSKNNENNL